MQKGQKVRKGINRPRCEKLGQIAVQQLIQRHMYCINFEFDQLLASI